MAIAFQYLIEGSKKVPVKLTKEQIERVTACRDRVYKLIACTPPNGAKFLASLKLCLAREQKWSLWKDGGCQITIERAPSNPPKPLPKPVPSAMKKVGKFGKARYENVPMGKPALSRLWALDVALDDPDALMMPSVKDRLNRVLEEEDPEADIEDTYKAKNDAKYVWTTLRLLALQNPLLFDSGDLLKAAQKFFKKKAKTPPVSEPEDLGANGDGDGDGETEVVKQGDVDKTTTPRSSSLKRRRSSSVEAEDGDARVLKRKLTEKAKLALQKEQDKMKDDQTS